jgi:predicted PurR-regulated permease PerM
MNQIAPTYIRQVLFIALIASIFGVLAWHLRFFIPALLGAYTLYVILRGPLFFLTERWHWHRKLASVILLLLSCLVVVLPINWLVGLLETQVIALFNNSENLFKNAKDVVQSIENQYHITLLTDDNIKAVSDWGVMKIQGVLGATVNGLALLIAMYFMLWFMLVEGKKMERSFFKWLPLKDENTAFVQEHLNNMVWGNALGIPLMGIVQGFAALMMYALMGVENPWLWFAITFFAGMMPIAGAALAYVPLSLILLAQGAQVKAIFIFLYGFIVVGSVDNIARMWVMRKINQTHPLITLFGVIAGLQLFGFIGFVFGPILIDLFILLLKIYHKEFHPKPLAHQT